MRRVASVGLSAALLACPAKREEQPRSTSATPGQDPGFDTPQPLTHDVAAGQADLSESAHHVVFADRTSQAYLLLLPGETKPEPPTRDELDALVRRRMPAGKYEAELALLTKLIQQDPPPPGFDGLPEDERARLLREDLLGLHIDLLPIDSLISPEALADAVLARELSPAERATVPTRRWALVLRADYRNQFAVRGLRLLQTLVRVVATERDALIHDADTSETMGAPAFTRRRLQASIGNIADQIAVVPFPTDDGSIRMTTRGMRRFGSVDLELQGLPRDPALLDRATFLLVGLAYKMVRLGEYDPRGYAIEVDDVIDLSRGDVVAAFAGRPGKLPPCPGCEGTLRLHLVERPPQPTDPHEHVVAQVVAPRPTSDPVGYDHADWAHGAIARLVGTPPD